MLGRRFSSLLAGGVVRRRALLRPSASALPTALSYPGRQLGSRWANFLASQSVPETNKSYTLTITDIPEPKASNLTNGDILQLFGAFEPYNIVIKKEEPKEKGGKPIVSASFQVPSLHYAKSIADSFTDDESWGDRIKVKREAEQYPVFIQNLPKDVTADWLKQQIDNASQRRPMRGSNKKPGKGVSMLGKTPIDAYPGYAVLRCPDQYVALGLLQGSFAIVESGGGPGEGNGQKAGAGVDAAAAGAAGAEDAAVVEDDDDDDDEEEDEDEDGADSYAVMSYAAWKTFPVRVNHLPVDLSAEEVYKAFREYMPYDLELLPPAPGATTRSAYLRFARREHAEMFIEEGDALMGLACDPDTKLVEEDKERERGGEGEEARSEEGQQLAAQEEEEEEDEEGETYCRAAFDPLFPVLVRPKRGDRLDVNQVLEACCPHDSLPPSEAEVVEVQPGVSGVLLRFVDPEAARQAKKALQESLDMSAELAWKPFSITVTNLPWEWDETDMQRVTHSEPYEVQLEKVPEMGRTRATIAFFTRAEAEDAYTHLMSSGMDDIKTRKNWLVYRLRVTDLPKDVTEAEIREGLRGHEPFQIDLLKSRRGLPKGEAILRFATYDEMLGAVSKLHGRDSLFDEAVSQGRWELPSVEYEKGRLAQLEAIAARSIESNPEVRAMLERVGAGISQEDIDRLDRHAKKTEDEDEQQAPQEAAVTEKAVVAAKEPEKPKEEAKPEEEEEDDDVNPYLVFPEGEWAKMIVDTDTTQKTLPGGRVMSYRMLVVVGNLKGSGGFGMGKGDTQEEAKIRAFREAFKNLIHLDLYRGRCITTPLHGRHNSCHVYIQAGNPLKPNKEGRMVNDILRLFGVECGEARSVGRRNPYSLIRAIFDALKQHEGVEEIARKRGRRLISLSKARYMGL